MFKSMSVKTFALIIFASIFSLSMSAFGETKKVVYIHSIKHKPHHGKPLFKYPNEHPTRIVTYTEEDLRKMQQKEFLQTTKHATYTRPKHRPAYAYFKR